MEIGVVFPYIAEIHSNHHNFECISILTLFHLPDNLEIVEIDHYCLDLDHYLVHYYLHAAGDAATAAAVGAAVGHDVRVVMVHCYCCLSQSVSSLRITLPLFKRKVLF